jgi:hypothetical protein
VIAGKPAGITQRRRWWCSSSNSNSHSTTLNQHGTLLSEEKVRRRWRGRRDISQWLTQHELMHLASRRNECSPEPCLHQDAAVNMDVALSLNTCRVASPR